MIAATGQCHEADVALKHHRLGGGWHAHQAEPSGELTLVHDAFADQMRIFGVMHDQHVEIARVGEGAAHHLCIHHAGVAVGKGHSTGRLQQAEFGHLGAGHALGQRRHGVDVDDGGVARAAKDEIHRGRVIDHRRRVRLTDDGGDAAGRSRLAGRGEGLAVAGAGFADESAHIDQARCHDLAAAVDHLGAFRHAGCGDAAPRIADHAVGDQHVARRIDIA